MQMLFTILKRKIVSILKLFNVELKIKKILSSIILIMQYIAFSLVILLKKVILHFLILAHIREKA